LEGYWNLPDSASTFQNNRSFSRSLFAKYELRRAALVLIFDKSGKMLEILCSLASILSA
jgi:hypothetical protein